jgi:hypothetical protein
VIINKTKQKTKKIVKKNRKTTKKLSVSILFICYSVPNSKNPNDIVNVCFLNFTNAKKGKK